MEGDWQQISVSPTGAYSVTTYLDGRMHSATQYDADDTVLSSTTMGYDDFNRQASVTDARTGTTHYEYYDNGQVREITAPDPDGAGPLAELVTSIAYDNMGRQILHTQPDASTVHTAYDLRGQVIKTWGSQTNPVEYTYDDQGRMLTLTTWKDFDVNNGTGLAGDADTTWIYDPQRGWLNRKEYQDGNGTDYIYTPGGRLASRTWERGIETRYAYTPAGDLLAVAYDDAGITPDILYAYNRLGQRAKVTDGHFAAAAFTPGEFLTSAPALTTTRYTHDFDNDPATLRLKTETVSGLLASPAVLTRSIQNGTETHGLPGRPSGYTLNSGATTDDAHALYTYDAAGRLHTVGDGTDTFTYDYVTNSHNLLASVTGPVHTVNYAYEPGRNAMTSVTNTRTHGTPGLVSKFEYTYNELGQRVDRSQSGAAVTDSTDSFQYDALGQVIASSNDVETVSPAWNPTYAFDMIGNRDGNSTDLNGTTDYTADLLNQYTQIDTDTPEYDEDGNLTSQGNWTYTWNGENRLIEATDGTNTLSFEYDFQGRLIKRTHNNQTEIYLYDDWNRIARYTGGVLLNDYLWGRDLSGSMQGAGGVGGLLREGNLYPLYDANGNITQKLDANGDTQMSVTYDPFGNIIDGTLVGEYSFSTKPLINDLNWHYYGFRYYDPETGRWPNRDPIEEEGGYNLYGFAGNDGVNSWDYLGLSFWANFQDSARVVAGTFSVVFGSKLIAASPVTFGTSAILGAGLVVLGTDQILYGADNLQRRFRSREPADGSPIQVTYRSFSRTVTGRDNSGLETFFDASYFIAEISSACATGYIAVSSSIKAVKSTQAIHSAGRWIVNSRGYIEWGIRIEGGVNMTQASGVVVTEAINVIATGITFFERNTEESEVFDPEVINGF